MAMIFFNHGKLGFLAKRTLIKQPAPQARVLQIASLLSLFAGAVANLTACSSTPPPLLIKMNHPGTGQTLTCTASDQRPHANSSALAAVVEACAKQLEARGFIREN